MLMQDILHYVRAPKVAYFSEMWGAIVVRESAIRGMDCKIYCVI